MRKSDSVESNECDDLLFGIAAFCRSSGPVIDDDGGILHSGLIMMPDIPSKMVGRSVAEIAELLLPFTTSSNAVHHLFNTVIRRSRSSARRALFDGWSAYLDRNGSSAMRTILAFCKLDFVWKLGKGSATLGKYE